MLTDLNCPQQHFRKMYKVMQKGEGFTGFVLSESVSSRQNEDVTKAVIEAVVADQGGADKCPWSPAEIKSAAATYFKSLSNALARTRKGKEHKIICRRQGRMRDSCIKQDMKIKLRMEGAVNGHNFVIEGEGRGKPYEGTQTIDLKVTEGGPLPFAYDILTSAYEYGNRAFTKYPADIPDYFKQTFPEGYSWERTMTYEDQSVCTVSSDIRMEGDCFIYDIRFHGVNFPPNGPVMQKTTLKWEPSTEKMYVRDGVLKGDVNMALLLEGGGHYRCDFKSTYKAKKGVRLPSYHFVDHRIEILSHDKDYIKVKLYENAVARCSMLPSQAK